MSASRCASPSDSRMSGEKVSRASRAPTDGHGRHRADHDLARITEQVGAGNGADVGAGAAEFHRPPLQSRTAAW